MTVQKRKGKRKKEKVASIFLPESHAQDVDDQATSTDTDWFLD